MPQAFQDQRQEGEKVLVAEATNPTRSQTSGPPITVPSDDLPATEPAVELQGLGREPFTPVEEPDVVQADGLHVSDGLWVLFRRPHLKTSIHFSGSVFKANQIFRQHFEDSGR